MNKTERLDETVEIIERWIRKGDGTVDITYSYDGGKTYIKKGEAHELSIKRNKDTL